MKFIFMDIIDHELHVCSIVFQKYDQKINIIVGTTIGYLIQYENIELYRLGRHVVLNNRHIEESILDIALVDLRGNGELNLIVYYFNRVL